MPHQHHFLSRLDRLSTSHVDTALTLYREPELVKWVLARVKLPEGAPRVAISLDDPGRGPFLVVTRAGIFVTCLGLDMSPGDLPVVPRGQLDAQLAARSDYKARVDVFIHVADERGGSRNLLDRLLFAAQDLSREEMTALSALQPIYEFELFRLLVRATAHLDELRRGLLPILQRAPRLRPNDITRRLLKSYWRDAYLVGHLSVLAGLSGPKLVEAIPESVREEVLQISLSWSGVRQGMMVHALRAAWLAARLGRVQFALHKEHFAEARTLLTAFDSGMALTAIAFRHARYRAEIQKLMKAAGQSGDNNRPQVEAAVLSSTALEADPEELERPLLAAGRAMVHRMVASLPPTSPFAFRRTEDVPAELARTALLNATNSFVDAADVRLPMFLSLAWLGRAEPEDLYFPRAFLDALRERWEPEHTYKLLRPLASLYKPVQARPSGPSRQGPCPCGSTRKFKRCCGESGAEAFVAKAA